MAVAPVVVRGWARRIALQRSLRTEGLIRRRQQLVDRHAERRRDLDEHDQRRIAGARLERRYRLARHRGCLGQRLLRQCAGVAQAREVASEVLGGLLVVHRAIVWRRRPAHQPCADMTDTRLAPPAVRFYLLLIDHRSPTLPRGSPHITLLLITPGPTA